MDSSSACVPGVPEGFSVLRDEPLARHTPMRCGGTCDAWVVVQERGAFKAALKWCRSENLKWTVLGHGSRVVVRDGGLSGAVLRLGGGFERWSEEGDGWWVGAATPLAVLPMLLGEGAAALAHAPGSVGASVALDPGWKPWVDRVRYLHRGGERESTFEEMQERRGTVVIFEVLLRPTTGLLPGPEEPYSWYEPLDRGDVGETIAEASLGGARLREICIPDEIPDAFVNLGGGTAKDIALLQRSIIERVHRVRGEQLKNRMQWLGRS